MKKKFIIIVLVAVIAAGFVYSIIGRSLIINKASATKSVPVELTIQNGKPVESNVTEGTTALEHLKKQAKVITKGEGANAFVVSINGIMALESKNEFWSFYVNGKMAEVGAGSYKLKKDDKIKWKLETF